MQDIRNFSIIAHIDHGKSTLADRMLQITGTVSERDMQEQFLDKIDLERERGITIKLQPARMKYVAQKPNHKSQITNKEQITSYKEGATNEPAQFILNLIDTPGHIDFSYEVSRALAACEGAILLVDATQGIEAQTLANLHKAQQANLTIIPVVNKIDLPSAHPEDVALDLVETLGFSEDEILFTSGKTGEGVSELLEEIIKKVPAPTGEPNAPLRALIFDSFYDQHKGVVAHVRIVDGALKKGELYLMNTNTSFEPLEIGFVTSTYESTTTLKAGDVGYVATGLKDINKVRVGDTITITGKNRAKEPLPGYHEPKPMVYANLFPQDADQIKELRDAVERYNLTDAAFTFEPFNSPIMGSGFRCGFLGLLHVDVVRERIEREYGVATQITTPNVLYHVTLKKGETIHVQSAPDMPDPTYIEKIEEPWCKVSLFSKQEYIGALMKVSEEHRGEFIDMQYFARPQSQGSSDSGQGDKYIEASTRVELHYNMPLSEVISNYHDQIKSVSSGYASLDYEVTEYRAVDLVKLEILLNKEPHPALSRLVVREQAVEIGKKLVETLKEALPRQQFKVPIQAAIGGNVVARADLPAVRKDVTAKLYGGDRTRKDKLLRKQAKGKKRLQAQGKVSIPHEVYQKIINI